MPADTPQNVGILSNLVTQFSSATDCFRELVQNSVDAGSSSVEIATEYRAAGDDDDGAILIHIDDWGEGMDRSIIDQQFTRLFSSTKRRDLTKIGKFGIGFVSVFALEPRAVIVKTGRGGEYWEVFFREDRAFQVTPLSDPVEGTQITLVLAGDIGRYAALVRDIRDALKRWCLHAEAEVGFEDRTPADGSLPTWERINEPFEVEGRCAQTFTVDATEVAIAFSSLPEHSFFNRGLSLASGARGTEALGDHRERFDHVSFKISSPYFGHTLTRESVVRDDHFHAGMRILRQAVVERLVPSLADELEELLGTERWGLEEARQYRESLGFLAREPRESLLRLKDRPILRTVDGAVVTPDLAYRTWRHNGRLLLTDTPSELLDELLRQDAMVLWGRPPVADDDSPHHGPIKQFLRRYVNAVDGSRRLRRLRWDRRITSPESVYFPILIDDEPPAAVRPLLAGTDALMRRRDSHFAALVTCRLASPDGHPPLYVVGSELGSVMARPPRPFQRIDRSGVREQLLSAAVNRDHPHFRRLLTLFRDQPAAAVQLLARCLDLTEPPPPGSPERLASPSEMTSLHSLEGSP